MTEINPYSSPKAESADLDEEYQPKLFATSGRIGRLRYVAYGLALAIIPYVIMIIPMAMLTMGDAEGMLYGLAASMISALYIATLVFYFILIKRRLNDCNKSGWLSLLTLVPLVNLLLILYVLLRKGDEGVNDYGPAPVSNPPWLWLVVLILPTFIIGIIAGIAIPAYQDYVSRAAGM